MGSAITLKPMSMGGMLDRSASLWRACLNPLTKLFFPFGLAQFLAAAFLERTSLHLSDLQTSTAVSPEILGQLGKSFAGFVVTVIVIWFSSLLSTTATCHFVGQRELVGKASVPETFAFTLQNIGRALSAGLGWGLAGLGWTMVGALPGVVLLIAGTKVLGGGVIVWVVGWLVIILGWLVALLPWFLSSMMLGPILGMEDKRGWSVYRRARRLVAGRAGPHWTDAVWLRASVTFTVMLLFLMVLSLIGQLPIDVLRHVYGGSVWDLHAQERIPLALAIPAKLFVLVVSCLLGPLQNVFLAFFYLDLRARKEGLDLELALAIPPSRA